MSDRFSFSQLHTLRTLKEYGPILAKDVSPLRRRTLESNALVGYVEFVNSPDDGDEWILTEAGVELIFVMDT